MVRKYDLKKVRERHRALAEQLEKEVAEGKFGDNPSEEDMAAVLSLKKKINRVDVYNKKAYDTVSFRLRRDGDNKGGVTAESIRRTARSLKLSINEYVISRLVESMEAHGEAGTSVPSSDMGKTDDGEVTLFMPEYEAEPIVIEGEEANLLRDLADASGKSVYDMIREFVASKQNNGFWRDRE